MNEWTKIVHVTLLRQPQNGAYFVNLGVLAGGENM